MKTSIEKISYSPKQKSFIFSPFDHLFDVNEGSIRSGKTAADCARMAVYYMLSPSPLHLVTAYNQEQAYKLWIEADQMGLAYIFDGSARLKRDRGGDCLDLDLPNGHKKIYFKGGGKSNSANAIRGISLGSVAYSEINLLNAEFLEETFRRTAAAPIRYHLGDLNPPAPQDPIVPFFDAHNAHWLHWTAKDNPIYDAKRLADLEAEYKRQGPYKYKRDWLGERVMPQGVIYSQFDQSTMIDQTLIGDPVEMFFETDAGQDDATTMSCNIVTRRQVSGQYKFVLNRVANYYHSGRETGEQRAMSTYADDLRQFIRWCVETYHLHYSVVQVDPASLALRMELIKVGIDASTANNNGHEVIGGQKGIEVGIQRKQNLIANGQYRLVEPPEHDPAYDHYHYLRELSMYVRDEATGKPVDANNHAMDESRYAANYFYANYM